MGAWGNGLLENDSGCDLWDVLVTAGDLSAVAAEFARVFQEYDRFENAVKSGSNFVSLSPEEIEQRIAAAKATPGSDNEHWSEFEEVMRETYSEPIEWEGTREADQVLAAALVLHAIVTRTLVTHLPEASSASNLLNFDPPANLLLKAQTALLRIAANPAKRKESRGWTKRVNQALAALRDAA
ncbi:hypothetical protein AACH06_29640 [Ideonella sp. DXS29W]|uniref:DUF4259 domain-containing protein n=1 Tax=Ideonella lacteola TaxID=2984193 RepID=A0ABU9BYZ7_9BURK